MVAMRLLPFAGLCLLLVGCTEVSAPVPIRPLSTITVGEEHSCALTDQGKAFCWGSSRHGQVGSGEVNLYAWPVAVATSQRFQTIDAGHRHTCAIDQDRIAYCWGSNALGQLGSGGGVARGLVSHVPVPVAGGERFLSISAGKHHTCGVSEAGRVLCWGDNEHGQLGRASLVPRLEPTPIASEVRFLAVAAGGYHTCALDEAGRVHCWGRNSNGQLGDRSDEDRAIPAPVSGQVRFSRLTAGDLHSCALTTGIEIYCWGANMTGELGHNWFSPGLDFPAAVSRPEAYTHVSAGNGYTCSLDQSGQGYCWGAGALGQLGTGMTENRAKPIMVRGPSFATIAAGTTHTCALDRAGRGYCWGTGDSGQLGTRTTTYSPAPVTVDWARLR